MSSARVLERSLRYRLENASSVMCDADLADWLRGKAATELAGEGFKFAEFEVLHANVGQDLVTREWFVEARARMLVSNKTAVPVEEVAPKIPILADEVVRLLHVLFSSSVAKDGTPAFWLTVVDEVVRTGISQYAISHYCGPDSGLRPAKDIVLAIFVAMDDFFKQQRAGEELAKKNKTPKQGFRAEVLAYIRAHRPQAYQSDREVVSRLLAVGQVPLSADTAVAVIDSWICDPDVFARALDRLFQTVDMPVEVLSPEPISSDGAAQLGLVAVEEKQGDLGASIISIIQTILKSGHVSRAIQGLERMVAALGLTSFIGKKIDESLDPNIDVDIMICQAAQKLLADTQSPGMYGVGVADRFYDEILPAKLRALIPGVVYGSVEKVMTVLANVFRSRDMLRELVYYYVLPRLADAVDKVQQKQQPILSPQTTKLAPTDPKVLRAAGLNPVDTATFKTM